MRSTTVHSASEPFPARAFTWVAEARTWTACLVLAAACVATPAWAQPHSSRTGLPGGGRAVLLQPPATVATFTAAGGYAYTGAVLGESDRHHRMAGRLALAVHPIEPLSVGIRMGGYRDAHSGDSGADDSIVGDFALFVLARVVHVGPLRLGVGADVWAAPGDGLGFEVGAISPTLTLYSQFDLGERFALTARVGYLHDRSRRTVPAGQRYSRGDQVSLGVTSADALLLGLGAAGHVGIIDVYAEVAVDLLVRRESLPLGASRSSAVVGVMANLGDRIQLGAELGLHLGSYPVIRDDRLYRVDPRVSMMLLLTAHLGALPSNLRVDGDQDVAGFTSAALRGTVVDEGGSPVAGAVVRLEPSGETPADTRETTTAADGGFVLRGVLPGDYELVLRVEGRHDARTTHRVDGDLDLATVRVGSFSRTLRGRVEAPGAAAPLFVRVRSGDLEVARVEVSEDGAFTLEALPPGVLGLEIEGDGFVPYRVTLNPELSADLPTIRLVSALPDAEIRGTVSGPGGNPVEARIQVLPEDQTLVANPEGRFSVVTTPGEHTVRIEADGYVTQERRVVVEQRGVVVLEVHLRVRR